MNAPVTCTRCDDLHRQVQWLTNQNAKFAKAIDALSAARPLRQIRELRRITDALYKQVETGVIVDPSVCDLQDLSTKADDLDDLIERVRDDVDERDEQIRRLEERITALEHGGGCDHDRRQAEQDRERLFTMWQEMDDRGWRVPW